MNRSAIDQRTMRRHAGSAARLVRALSSEHRLMVLCALASGELSVGALNELVPLSQSALSQHLAVLRRERLVTTRREAQTIYYQATPGIAQDVVHLLYDHYCRGTRPLPRTAASRRNGARAKVAG
jgi:DNA-binding transcriptional ArsR family regulator